MWGWSGAVLEASWLGELKIVFNFNNIGAALIDEGCPWSSWCSSGCWCRGPARRACPHTCWPPTRCPAGTCTCRREPSGVIRAVQCTGSGCLRKIIPRAILKLKLENLTDVRILYLNSIMFWGSGCSTAVERTPPNREVMGSYPARCWFFFSSLSTQKCVLN